METSRQLDLGERSQPIHRLHGGRTHPRDGILRAELSSARLLTEVGDDFQSRDASEGSAEAFALNR